MAICTGDSYVEVIEKTECIGNSLYTINSNFAKLDQAVCSTTSTTDNLLTINGIVKRDGATGEFSDAQPGYDYVHPGDTMDFNISGTKNLTIAGTATFNSTIVSAGGINSGGPFVASNTSVLGGAVTCNSTASIAGTLTLRNGASVTGTITCGAIDSSGRLYTSSYIYSKGIVYSESDVIAFYTSDKRLKQDIAPISNALEKVSKLQGVDFEWNTDLQDIYQGKDTGVIAQEVEEIMPTAVTTRDNGYKAVKYEKLIPLLIEAVKELKEQNVLLKQEIEALKAK